MGWKADWMEWRPMYDGPMPLHEVAGRAIWIPYVTFTFAYGTQEVPPGQPTHDKWQMAVPMGTR